MTFIVSKGVSQDESDRGMLGKDSDWCRRAETLRGRPLARQRKTPARDHLPTGGLWRSLAPLPCSGELEHEQGLQGITDLVLGHFGVRSGDRPWRSLWTRVQSQSWSCTSGRAQEKELDTGNHMENK